MEQPLERDGPVPRPDGSAPTARSPFPVVGIGASAGGLQALRSFLAHAAPTSGVAFVVILHLAPELESNAAAVLQRDTAMPVIQVTEATPLAPDHVYVIPPARQLVAQDGTLRLITPKLQYGRRVPIDAFFRTLAESHGSQAGAVILSGSGSDGALGLKAIKEAGGVVCVQDPQEAEFDGMPRSAIATGLVDFVLPVAALPEVVLAFWRRGAAITIPDPAPEAEDVLREVFAVLRVRTGHDFTQYKRPTLLRRLARRMQVTGVTDLPAYLALLRSRADEVQALLQDLLISVTNFFRDPASWVALEALVPRLFADKAPDDQVRVWVAGCATGEEAYTVAMLLMEHAARLAQPPTVQVFATDIDEEAIAQARRGIYPETIAGDISAERLGRYFKLEQSCYRVRKEIRDRVLFASHNLLRDAPFSRLDLITSRNLLIYLNREAQQQVLQIFHFSLAPGGYLLLGSSESADGTPSLFTPVEKKERLFQRRKVPQMPPPTLALAVAAPRRPPIPAAERNAEISSLSDLHRQLLAEQAPPSVIVNAEGEIVHLSRGVGRFLHFEEGELARHLLQVIHPDLRLELRTALFRARAELAPVEVRRVRVALETGDRLVDLRVRPIGTPEWAQGYQLVLFTDMGASDAPAASVAPDADAAVLHLEAELQQTRDQLRTVVEQYETSVEEQKSANEELQAINEELRAMTEELETSKEELQSVNEELSTVNQELRHKVDEVTLAHNDLQNLIASTQIATLFLDRGLRIKRYTPSAEAIFNLLPTDLNRPLAHITHTLRDDQLVADAARVIETRHSVSREITSTGGQWYLARMLPYRTDDDHIEGVVSTFVDITDRKQAEAALEEARQSLEAALEAADMGAWDLDLTTGRARTNLRHNQIFGYTAPVEGWGTDIFRTHILPEDHPEIEARFARAIETGVYELEVRVRWPDGSVHWVHDQGRVTYDAQGRPVRMAGLTIDITERKEAEAEREGLLHAAERAREEAEAAVRVRDQFLSIASHELRTPLTPLLGYASMLEQAVAAPDTPPYTQRLLRAIMRQVERLNTLVGQLLDVTRLQRGQFTLQRKPLDVGALVARVVEEVRLTLPAPRQEQAITLVRPDEPVMVLGDGARLESVVQNLLSNALKYSPLDGTVDVRVTPRPADVTIAVMDAGIGIPSEARAHLFEPFYRAGNISPQSSGFGIGLYIVREIVTRHGGQVEVESVEGAGSTFRVVLPLLANGPAPSPEHVAATEA